MSNIEIVDREMSKIDIGDKECQLQKQEIRNVKHRNREYGILNIEMSSIEIGDREY